MTFDEYDNGTHGEDRAMTKDELIESGMNKCCVCDRIAPGAETESGHFICDDCTEEFDALMATYDTKGWSDGDRLCGRCGDFDFTIGDESLCSKCYTKENEAEVIAEMKHARIPVTEKVQLNAAIAGLCTGLLIACLIAGFLASLGKHSEAHLDRPGFDMEAK